MKWYSYLICFILIIVGIFCSIELVDLLNVKSGEYGYPITFETQNNYEIVSRFDYGTIGFDTEDYINYSNVSVFEPTDFNGKNTEYEMFFNDTPLNNVVVSAGRISGNVDIVFYDLDGQEITTANLYFNVEYLASGTKVTTEITNTNNSVSYLNSYMELNGAVLKIMTKGV